MEEKNNYIAVITGDIVRSGALGPEARQRLPEKLKSIFAGLSDIREGSQRFSIFRGDSFQGMLQDPSDALNTALWIRTSLLSTHKNLGCYDCRMAIGIGKVSFLASSALESDGEAFRHSGPALDTMDKDERLKIVSPWEQINKELQVSCKLLDVIQTRWTGSQAGIIAETLAGKTQRAIANSLNISQPAVSASLKASGWNATQVLIERFETLIKNKLQ